MKSCLKLTPPYTPLQHSSAGTPSGSGTVSPVSEHPGHPPLRKTVSFCEEALEEYYEADDWDRTPAPVAPKLSYQDILELKQIMKSLPRAPASSYRPPFSSTSLPSPPPSTHQPFPVSRFAMAPSLTPSKWKNRDDSASAVDPVILPYLDSVPIRLLPLLPPSQEPSGNGGSSSATPAAAVPSQPVVQSAVSAEPTRPPIPPTPVSSGTNSPSMCSSATVTPPHSPLLKQQEQQTPTRRKPNFAFLPLLPVQEEPKAAPPPPPKPTPAPVRKFNMAFVPLLPPESPATPVAEAPRDLTPQSETPPREDHLHDGSEHELVNSPPPTFVPLNISRSSSSTPSLSSAASDTDTESEAPSIGSPLPSSPSPEDTALSNYFDPRPHVDSESMLTTINPYFPVFPANHNNETFAVKRSRLEALPSPALVPPSPLTLNPPSAPVSPSGTIGKRKFASRPSNLSSLRDADSMDALSQRLTTLSTATTPETPELTIEYLRDPAFWQSPPAEGEGVLGPSIRRR